MKKLIKPFSVLFAAAALMTACSNEEPMMEGNDLPDNVQGMDAYLRVNIQDAGDMISKATPNDTVGANTGDYVYGTEAEHTVANAKFYFYTANGAFMQEGTLTNFTPGGSINDNVEVFGQKVLVLKGLTQNTTPTYMITVLNVPEGFNPGATLDDTRKALVDIKSGDNFVMSTTSFIDESFTDQYGTNKLKTTDFQIQPAGTVTPDDIFETNPNTPAVEVYVERLAAKIEVEYMAQGVNEDGYVALNIPVAGNPNNVGDGDATLSTVYVKLSNWGLNAVARNSYMTKDISMTETFNGWNAPERYRSFWGKSTLWGTDLDSINAKFIHFADAKGTFKFTTNNTDGSQTIKSGTVTYCPENTNELSKIAEGNLTKNRNLTSVLFTAQVFEKDGDEYKALDMVRYNGSLYKKDWFLQFVLNNLQINGKLNYYNQIVVKEPETDAEGNITTEGEYKYVQLNPTELALDFALTQDEDEKGTGMIQVVTNLNAEDNVKYYTRTETEGKETWTPATFGQTEIDALNKALASFDNTKGELAVANAYTSGKMFYTIPVEHLIKRSNKTEDIAVGNYGVVRNHWYLIQVNQILRLGTGIFQPEEGGETIYPDDQPEDPTYYLGARINILSWKIVKQTVDL